jgi:hypothetical protein
VQPTRRGRDRHRITVVWLSVSGRTTSALQLRERLDVHDIDDNRTLHDAVVSAE